MEVDVSCLEGGLQDCLIRRTLEKWKCHSFGWIEGRFEVRCIYGAGARGGLDASRDGSALYRLAWCAGRRCRTRLRRRGATQLTIPVIQFV